MRLTASDLELSRTRPSQTKLDMFVFHPRTVMSCLVNDSAIAKGSRVITYDSISTGTFASVEEGMTLLVGTTAGASDVGRIRIRSATSTQFTVSENSNISWVDNLHLTVLRYFEIWPVFPRIIQQPSNPTQVTFYKDYDIPHTTQNFDLGTYVNAGSHRPILLENGTGTSFYSSTGTYNLLEAGLTYDWAFEGGNPTGSTSANPGTVYYTTPGDYVTRLKVTSANGVTDSTYRYVAARNKIGEGTNTPVARWKMNNLGGSRGEAGYSAEFTVYDVLDIEENALVMLRAEDWYGGTKRSLGGNYPNTENIFFVGYVDVGSIHYNYKDSYVTFTVTSVTGIMKKMTGFSVSVESSSNPNTWFELRDMDVRRAMYHYLKWHSTVLKTTDFNFVGQDYKIQFYDADRSSIFDSVDELLRGALMGSLSSDRQGRLWAEVDPRAYPNPTGSFLPVMDISRRDWRDEPRIDDPINDTVSYLELGGIAYSGSVTGTFGAFLSGAPGLTPSFSGNVDQISGLALAGQSQLNQLSGNIWANENQDYPHISMEMANPSRNLDIAPQEVVGIRVLSEDTVKRVEINKLYLPESISFSYDSEDMILVPSIEFQGLVTGVPGDTITIPDVVDDDTFLFPEYTFPKFPSVAFPTLAIIDPLSVKHVIIHVADYGVYYTDDFDSVSPTWYAANTGLPQTDLEVIEVSATGRLFCHVENTLVSGRIGSVYTANFPGGVWYPVFTSDSIDNPEGYPFPRGERISGIGVNRNSDDELIVMAGLTVTIGSNHLVYAWYGTSGGVARVPATFLAEISGSVKYTRITRGILGWLFSYFDAQNDASTAILTPTGSGISNIIEHEGSSSGAIISTRSKKTLDTVSLKSDVYPEVTTNDGVSWNWVTGSAAAYGSFTLHDRYESIMTSDDGVQIVVGTNASKGLRYSNNSGASWITGSFSGAISALWQLGEDVYVAGANNKIYAIQGLNSGVDTAIDKTGNLRNLITGAFTTFSMRHYTS